MALLDAASLDGGSPEAPGAFACGGCGDRLPIKYVALPRSEVNRVTGSAFNRARVELAGDSVIARTIEALGVPTAVEAIYEFSSSLSLRQASYGDRYWDLHRALEAQGKLDHPRERCPDRRGPPEIQVWEPTTGWKIVRVERGPPG